MTTANPEGTRPRRFELPGLPTRLRLRRQLAHVVATESTVRPRTWFGSLRAALDRPLTSYYLLVGASALLLTIGLIMVLSASSVYSYEVNDGDSYALGPAAAGFALGSNSLNFTGPLTTASDFFYRFRGGLLVTDATVPEPGTFGLLGLGLLGVAWSGRRRVS